MSAPTSLFEAEVTFIRKTLENVKTIIGDLMTYEAKDLLSPLGDTLVTPPDHITVKVARELEMLELNCDEIMNALRARDMNPNIKKLYDHVPVALSSHYYTGDRRAAVLVALFEDENHELHVLLTKRTSHLRSHAGEIALPGGRFEQSDKSLVETALRESHEEIGLSPSEVTVIKEIHPSVSRNMLLVSPVLALVPSDFLQRCRPNPDEVETVFSVPLRSFLKDDRHQTWDNEYKHGTITEMSRTHSFIRGEGDHRVFGLTANILLRIALIAYEGDSVEFEPFAEGQPLDHESARHLYFKQDAEKVDQEKIHQRESEFKQRNVELSKSLAAEKNKL
ncbi:hypothetical protein SmJEL517_g05651 [Synchytrium microbalum]|uniref:Nudix hydrolase domain-containing protein n=1 Tax=Synchytrium microbalum TaxID=1806994 RepID=A0A507BUA7_9FUNG|nr:uncharacterized protein SmJEL517_g05651 [Synchytrium microbalum]TPX30878.1 hypothetical protein SmJEL517_g05651 [Synchytrium microbalum]